MRVFYFLMTALLFVSRTETVSAASEEESNRPIASEYRNGNPRVLRTPEGEQEDEDRVNLQVLTNKLSLLDPTKLDEILKFDDIFNTKKLNVLLNAKNLDESLTVTKLNTAIDAKKVDALIDPKKIDTMARIWAKKDVDGLTMYVSKKLFPQLKNIKINERTLGAAMRQSGNFDEHFIQGMVKQYEIFRTRVV